jgi:uncharacterized protein YkvS
VNGLRGVVKKLDTDSIEVKFLINEKPVRKYLGHSRGLG